MLSLSRRRFLQLSGIASAAVLNSCSLLSKNNSGAQVVVVGGGFAGATAAKYIRLLDNSIKVILIEPKAQYM